MQKIVASRGELHWSQPSFMKQEFELSGADDTVATLKFRSSFGTYATGESGDGCWTFKRVGFWQQKVSIRPRDSETEVAVFQNQTWSGGGTLQFATGRRFLATTNFWNTNLEFQDERGERLVRFDCGGTFRLSALVEVSPKALSVPELPLLVLTAWYLAVMLHRDSAGGGAAAAAAAG